MPGQEHTRPVQLLTHPCSPSPSPLLSVLWGRILALSEVSLQHPLQHPPFWLGSSGVQTTGEQEQFQGIFLVPCLQKLLNTWKRDAVPLTERCHFLHLEKPSEWEDAGEEFCSLEQGEPSSKPQLEGKGLPSQGQTEPNNCRAEPQP